MMSFITCEPTSSVPTDPAEKHPGPGIDFPAKQEIRNELPTSGGQNRRKPHSKLPTAPPPQRIAHQAEHNQQTGKKARNILKATACDTMPHCGMTLASARNSFSQESLAPLRKIISGSVNCPDACSMRM